MIYLLDPADRNVFTRSHCEVEGLGFFVTITSAKTGMRDRAAMINCAYELQLYMQVAKDVVINHVQMLCPPELTRTGTWRLEDLVEIVCFRGIDSQESTVVYRTSQSIYKLGELDLRKKKNPQIWYSKKILEGHIPRISERASESVEHEMYAPLYLKSAAINC